jgi:UDP-3-O-[3-hydroxymyristoyl] glucosamine N-acyltransferase
VAILLKDLAQIVNGEIVGDPELEVTGVGGVNDVQAGEITFAQNRDYFSVAETGPAVAIITNEEIESKKTLLKVANPRLAFAKICWEFSPQYYKTEEMHETAVIADDVELGADVSIGPNVTIESGSRIGDKVRIGAGVYIGTNVMIDSQTLIHPGVVVEADTEIGKEVIIQAGAVIASDGYGFETTSEGHYKIPQLGNVIIEDRVELGANVTVDRGTTGPTIIGEGTKVDNLVHVAHNVKIGKNCLLIAQAGIAGSAELGDWVTMAGKSGVTGHLEVGDKTTIAAQSIAISDVPVDSFYSGYPAHNHKNEMRIKAARRKLPEMVKELRQLKKEVKYLKEKLEEEKDDESN